METKEIRVKHYYFVEGFWDYDEVSYEIPKDFREREIKDFVEKKNLEFLDRKSAIIMKF